MKSDSQSQSTYTNCINYTNAPDEGEFKCNKCKKCNNLTLDICEEMFKKIRDKIHEQYIEGTLSYIKERHKSLHRKIWKAEEQVAAICRACTDEKYPSTVSELTQALDEYYKFYTAAIALFKGYRKDISI